MSIYNMLFEWQKKLVDKFKHRDSFGLFLDMGLGKTPVSLGFAEANNCTKAIIISINAKALEKISVSGSWFDWASKSSMNYAFKDKFAKEFSNEPEVFLINFESLFKRGKRSARSARIELKENIEAFINSCKGHNVALIVDESHKVKDLQSMQTLSIQKIQKELKIKANKVYTYLLTGTPFTQGYIDLYAQLKLLGHTGTKAQFVNDFCILDNRPGLLGWQQPICGYKNLEGLYKLVHEYAITTKSEDVNANLPEKIFVNHSRPMSQAFKMMIAEKYKGTKILEYMKFRGIPISEAMYTRYNVDKLVNNPFFRNIAYPDLKWLAETTGTNWLRCRQLSIGFQGNSSEAIWYDRTRLEQVKHFLANNYHNYLLFYNYTPELIELYDICEELGYNIDVYCGECKSLYFYDKWANLTEEQRLVSDKKNIILANFQSGSTGMNWQLYNQCILFSVPLYRDFEQGIKRLHRTGQKHNVVYHKFYQDNWLDHNMLKAIDAGVQYSHDLFEDDLKRIQDLLSSED